MEHAQRAFDKDVAGGEPTSVVLILILMEHAQRANMMICTLQTANACLNPYFNGTCSKSQQIY